ncbi:expressed unknown protein [Seminavis robusta]|uniref:Beta-lactamase-related domain-containing protein n=1 Tax=Seminavis robusta TaxID=568900 RepID=A0A9N8HP56_9STRA|nr:expressed unknown protein [Seminavis robusta]|eukprot:Sro875_g214320.1 n/a (121) ;mRNA; f:6709-7071
MIRPRYGDEVGMFWHTREEEFGGVPRTILGHTGGDPGAVSYFYIDPATRTGIFVVSNGDGGLATNATMEALDNLQAELFVLADELKLIEQQPSSGATKMSSVVIQTTVASLIVAYGTLFL